MFSAFLVRVVGSVNSATSVPIPSLSSSWSFSDRSRSARSVSAIQICISLIVALDPVVKLVARALFDSVLAERLPFETRVVAVGVPVSVVALAVPDALPVPLALMAETR